MNYLHLIVTELLLLAQSFLACDPPEPGWQPAPMTDRVRWADTVVYGRVLAHYADPRFRYTPSAQIYTAEMEVFCWLKGGSGPAKVNISESGFIPGLCTMNEFAVGRHYVAFLRERDVNYVPDHGYEPADVPAESALAKLAGDCDLKPQYPLGHNGKVKMKCPALAPKCGYHAPEVELVDHIPDLEVEYIANPSAVPDTVVTTTTEKESDDRGESVQAVSAGAESGSGADAAAEVEIIATVAGSDVYEGAYRPLQPDVNLPPNGGEQGQPPDNAETAAAENRPGLEAAIVSNDVGKDPVRKAAPAPGSGGASYIRRNSAPLLLACCILFVIRHSGRVAPLL